VTPRPVKLGPNSVGWRESAIREWLDSREPRTEGAATTSTQTRADESLAEQEA